MYDWIILHTRSLYTAPCARLNYRNLRWLSRLSEQFYALALYVPSRSGTFRHIPILSWQWNCPNVERWINDVMKKATKSAKDTGTCPICISRYKRRMECSINTAMVVQTADLVKAHIGHLRQWDRLLRWMNLRVNRVIIHKSVSPLQWASRQMTSKASHPPDCNIHLGRHS